MGELREKIFSMPAPSRHQRTVKTVSLTPGKSFSVLMQGAAHFMVGKYVRRDAAGNDFSAPVSHDVYSA